MRAARPSFRHEHPLLFAGLVLAGLGTTLWLGTVLAAGWLLGRVSGPDLFVSAGVGVVEVSGPIATADGVIETLRRFRSDEAVRAVVLRIDSPGGAVGAAQEIFAEARRTDAVKPVVASLASVAASGGYYIALGARRIVANPGTLTGSIGVIARFPDLSELFAKIGYRSEVVKSGELKDLGSPDRALSARERAVLQHVLDDVHAQFIAAVAERRGLDRAAVAPLADGRIFSGREAKDLGLVDELGNFSAAIRAAAREAGLEEEDPELIYPASDGLDFSRLLAGQAGRWLLGIGRRLPSPAYLLP